MCQGIDTWAWVLVLHPCDICDYEDNFFLYDSVYMQSIVCDIVKTVCTRMYYNGACDEHNWRVVEYKPQAKPEFIEVNVADELLATLPFVRCKGIEVSPLLGWVQKFLSCGSNLLEACHLSVFCTLGSVCPLGVSEGWVDRAKCVSKILKSMDLGLDAMRWVEMQQLQGYEYHDIDVDAVATKFCLGERNFTVEQLSSLFDSFRVNSPPPSVEYIPFTDYYNSGMWVTSGSASGLRADVTVDGLAKDIRMTKNMIPDYYSVSTAVANLFKTSRLVCVLANKNEVGKQRPVVGAEPWSYLVMSWVMHMLKDWLSRIDGFSIYGDDLSLVGIGERVMNGKSVLYCRGDDLVVTVRDGRIFSFDFKSFDHQIPMAFTLKVWEYLCDAVYPYCSSGERNMLGHVSVLLQNVVLVWYSGDEKHEARMTGSLASGIRITSIVGTVVSFGLACMLRDSADPWTTVKLSGVLFDRSKCYLRRGCEFLRNYFGQFGGGGYPARSCIAILQHKPWLEAKESRVRAVFKAWAVTQQRFGVMPPYSFNHLREAYGCPQLYGGYGVTDFGWDFCRVDVDRERVTRVPIAMRSEMIARKLQVPVDSYCDVMAIRQIESIYGRVRQKVVSGGYSSRLANRVTRFPTIAYDVNKLEYWSIRLGKWDSMWLVSPSLASFVWRNRRWGTKQALAVASDGPEVPLLWMPQLPSPVLVPQQFGPGPMEGSLRMFYRTVRVDVKKEYLWATRMAS